MSSATRTSERPVPPEVEAQEEEKRRAEEAVAPPPDDDPKYQGGLREKTRGNELFGRQEFKKAILAYLSAMSYIAGTAEEKKKSAGFRQTKLSLHLNLAACYIKYKNKEDRALPHCDEALKLQKNHPKALYRKGMAYLAMRDLVQAKEWLLKAPQSAERDAALHDIAERDRQLDVKEKNTFAGMFDRHAGELYHDAKPAPPPPKDEDDEEEHKSHHSHSGSDLSDDEEHKRPGMQRIDVKKMREEQQRKQQEELAARAAGVIPQLPPKNPHPTFDGDREMMAQEKRQFAGMFDRHAGQLYPDAQPAQAPPKEESDSDEDKKRHGHGDDGDNSSGSDFGFGSDDDDDDEHGHFGHFGHHGHHHGHRHHDRPGMQRIDVKALREQQARAARGAPEHPTFDGDREMIAQEKRQFAGMFDRHAGQLYPDAQPARAPPKDADDADEEDEKSGDELEKPTPSKKD
ncbi:hypothetical protein PAPYR_1346 [Paratrimastix pyriformis]|uniref:TPR-like protein n=1 Tax=Paratrimastix pyriformis TaxID=342808 RepID=A0ABQ8USR8_9EUKA|nr:hypothetical protein PAPYR_1346 [Paratrimastix pyriformis]